MLDEQWNWKVNVDYSGLEQGARMAEQRMQQQALASSSQMHANYSMMQSAPYVGEMSGRGLIAQHTYQQAMYNSGLTSFYNTPLVNTRPEIAANYQQPTGLLEGPAYNTEQGASNLATGFRKAVSHLGVSKLRSVGNAIGMSDLGVYGAGDYSQRLIRSQQIAAEKISSARANLGSNFMDSAKDVASAAFLPASFFLPGGLLAHLALDAGVTAAGVGYDAIAGQRDAYKDTGLYFKDAFASNFKDRLGGGASYQRSANFVRGFQKVIAKDEFLKRDEYSSVLEMGATNGLFQTMDDEKKMLKGVENIANAIKAFNSIGAKIQEATKDIGLMANLGLNVAEAPGRANRFIGTLGLSAFNSNITQSEMMDRAVNAGTMMSHMGVDAAVGSQMYMQTSGMAGMIVRGGGISFQDVQKMGGVQGLTDKTFQGLASLRSTGYGDLVNTALMRDPSLTNKILSGNVGTGDLNKAVQGMTPTEYYNLQYKKSSFSTEVDEAANQYATLMLSMKDFQKKKGGGKFSEGEAKVLFESLGMESGDASAVLKTIMGSSAAQKKIKEEQLSQGLGVLMEANRKAAKPYTNWDSWWENSVQDKMFGKWGADWGANILDKQGNIYDDKMKTLTSDYVQLRSNVNSFEAVVERYSDPGRIERESSIRDRIRGANRQELRDKANSNDVTKNIMSRFNTTYKAQKDEIQNLLSYSINENPTEYGGKNLKNILDKSLRGEVLSEKELQELRDNKNTSYSFENLKSLNRYREFFRGDLVDKEAEEKSLQFLENTKDVRARVMQGFLDTGLSKQSDAVLAKVLDKGLNASNRSRDILSGYASSNDLEGATMFLAKDYLTSNGLSVKEFNQKYKSMEDLKSLSKEEQEAIGIYGRHLGNFISDPGEKKNFDKFLTNANEAGITGSRSLEELKKIRDASSVSVDRFNKSMEDFLGLKGMKVSSKTQVDIVSGAYKEQLIDNMLTSGDFRLAESIIGKEGVAKANQAGSKSDRNAMIRSMLESEQKKLGASLKENMKSNPQYNKLYTAVRAKSAGQSDSYLNLSGKNPEFLDLGEEAGKALLNESTAAVVMSDETVNSLNNLIGNEEDEATKDILRGSLAKLKEGKFDADTLFNTLEKSKNTESAKLGRAGQAFLKLKGLTGADYEKARLAVTEGLDLSNPKNSAIVNTLLEDVRAERKDINTGSQEFLSFYQASKSPQSPVYGNIGGTSSGSMLTVDQQKDLTSAYETQNKIAGIFESLKGMIQELPKSLNGTTPEEAKEHFGIVRDVAKTLQTKLAGDGQGSNGGIPVSVISKNDTPIPVQIKP